MSVYRSRFENYLVPIAMACATLSACSPGETEEATAQFASGLGTECPTDAIHIQELEPMLPPYSDPSWKKYDSYAGVLAAVLGQSAIRDGMCTATDPTKPWECAAASPDEDPNGYYHFKLINVNPAMTGQCTNFYTRFKTLVGGIPSQTAIGTYGLNGVNVCKSLGEGVCWDKNLDKYPTPWQFWLPLGMNLINPKGATLLHFPPKACWVKADYLDPTDPTVRAWLHKLSAVGVTSVAEQYKFNSWVDVKPIMADGGAGSVMPDAVTYFDTYDSDPTKNRLYIPNLVSWAVGPSSNQNLYFNLPLLVGGAEPRKAIMTAVGGTGNWSLFPKTDNPADPSSPISEGAVGVTTTIWNGKKTALLGMGHPNTSQYPDCSTIDPNKPGKFTTKPMVATGAHLTSLCWYTTLANNLAANSSYNPTNQQIQDIYDACNKTWNPATADSSHLHTLCMVTVKDFTPITFMGNGPNDRQKPHIWPGDDWQCETDQQADEFCKALLDDPCLGFNGVAGWKNHNCQNYNDTNASKLEAYSQATPNACSDGIDNDGNGLTDCADSTCFNAPSCDHGDGSCCSLHGGPGCDDEVGEYYICQCDPYCCTSNWDAVCIAEYTTAKTANPGQGYCSLGFGGSCKESSCNDGIDNTIPADGLTDCADPVCASMSYCEPANSGDASCCSPHSKAGCQDDAGQFYVCNRYFGTTGDSYCCTTSWDSQCVSEYKASSSLRCTESLESDLACGDGVDNDTSGYTDASDASCLNVPAGFPSTSCCTASTQAYCREDLVVADVCAVNAACCNGAWTSSCVASYNALAKYDRDSDGTADACELTLKDMPIWGDTWDYRSDKASGGTNTGYPQQTGEPRSTVLLTQDGTTDGYATAMVRAKAQNTATNPFTAYFEYRTRNAVGAEGTGFSFFWDKSNTGIQNNAPAPGSGLGFVPDNTGFAIFFDGGQQLIQVRGGNSTLTSVSATDVFTGNVWKRVAIKVTANTVTVYTWSGSAWSQRLSYTHTTNWESDSRGQNSHSVGFGAGTTATFGSEISLRDVNFSEFMRAFVSNEQYSGNLGGVAGADANCQRMAEQVGLSGSWKAWLSSSTVSAASHMAQSLMPYKLVDGTQIAASWADLTDGLLGAALNKDRTGAALSNIEVWTGTSYDGSGTGSYCSDWTSSSASPPYGTVGINSYTSSAFTSSYLQFCNRTNVALYCLEQPYAR